MTPHRTPRHSGTLGRGGDAKAQFMAPSGPSAACPEATVAGRSSRPMPRTAGSEGRVLPVDPDEAHRIVRIPAGEVGPCQAR